MRENCTQGSVRGAPGNRRPYRDAATNSIASIVVYFTCNVTQKHYIYNSKYLIESVVNFKKIGDKDDE